MRQLDIFWRSAWLLKHKVMEALFQREQAQPLQGMVSVDDAYLGGERVGGKRSRVSENKVAFVTAVELPDGHLRRVRADRVANFSFQALRDWHKVALKSDSDETSDGQIGCEVLRRDGVDHQLIEPPSGQGRYRDCNVSLAENRAGQPQDLTLGRSPRLHVQEVRPSVSC